jgi:hypothetical protein
MAPTPKGRGRLNAGLTRRVLQVSELTETTLSEVGAPLPGVAPVALQQGRYVAQVIRARLAGDARTSPFTELGQKAPGL